jgi:hypothetical protein
MAAMLACPRRHYWRYECGLRRDEGTEALRFGSAWHRAMEAMAKGGTAEAAYAAASRAAITASMRGHHVDPSDMRAVEHARTAFAAAFARMTEAEATVRRASAAETVARREYARAYRAACLPEVGR